MRLIVVKKETRGGKGGMRDVRKDYSSRYLNVGLSSICTCLHTTYTPTLVGCVQSRDEPEIAEERVCGYFIEKLMITK